MQDLNLMAVYAHVVEGGSFSAAARRLGTSRSAVSKAVAKLEKALGARLLNRSTRHLSVTEVGAAFAEHCSRILDGRSGPNRWRAACTPSRAACSRWRPR